MKKQISLILVENEINFGFKTQKQAHLSELRNWYCLYTKFGELS